ncbi:MAG: hypothetical protein RPT95_07780 [Candidatus Sedimenticola sp. (ex Thyasira tokunagai)]
MQNLKIDHWSKGIASFFAAAAIGSLAVSEKEIFVMCLGGFLFGLGEWINHKIYTQVVPGYGGIFHGQMYVRKNSLYGISFIVAGLILFSIATYKFINIPSSDNTKSENEATIESPINK